MNPMQRTPPKRNWLEISGSPVVLCRRALKSAALILMPLALSGCLMIGPDFMTPSTPIVTQWLEANSNQPRSNSGLTPRSEPTIAWWETFRDPVLDQLIAEAYAQNLSLQIAGARVLQARAQLDIAFGELFPQSQSVGGGFTQRKISQNLSLISDVEKVVDLDLEFATSEIGFDAQWELDVWGGIRRQVQSARANLAAQVADYDDALVTLTGDVAATYVNIRALQELIAIARKNIKLQQESLALTQLRFKNGVTTELDVQEATTLLNNTKALVPGLEIELQQAKNALAVLLGKPPEHMAKILGNYGRIPNAPGKVAVGIPAELLRRRPDIRVAELEAAAQSAQIGAAMTDLYPQFVLSGSIGLQASSVTNLLSSGSTAGVFNPGIVWDLFNYGRIQNNVRAQDAAFQALVANYQNTVLVAYAEVENAMVAFKKSKTQVALLRKSVASSQRAAEIATVQYKDGTADYSRVLNTQRALLQSEANLVEARSEVSENLVALYKALGGGWQIRKNQEFLPEAVLAEMAYRTDWGDLLKEGTETNRVN